ncbi:unnamed protein product [Clonostachys rosea]|uniref:non-specific serine/threonine protein kinase n=1 Tax=Bionectria ochroleuca TaxID=29856 RepID=A0ABY6U567_BIOOC|nr:unnamed protein product [Clonostachys rosea]
MAPHQLEVFCYEVDSNCEDLTRYKRYGLHPILLGDLLPKLGSCVSEPSKKPRYHIAQKIGVGSFSTVWLARDIEQERYVALKACDGTEKPLESNEVRVLKTLQHKGQGKPGSSNIIQLYDTFTIEGPNGYHEILITEVVIPFHSISSSKGSSRAVRQLMEGFSSLHEEGIFHGVSRLTVFDVDPHYGNFGIAVPQLQQFDESEIVDFFSNPEIEPVVPIDPHFQRDSLPAYVVQGIDIESFLKDKKTMPPKETWVYKILDLGRAYLANEPIQKLPGCCPSYIRPPEIFMHLITNGKIGPAWSKEADIWAIGCLFAKIMDIFLLAYGGSLESRLYNALDVGGPPPEEWAGFWDLEEYRQKRMEEGRDNLPALDRKKA